MHVLTKEELRNQLVTARHKLEQAEFEIKQLRAERKKHLACLCDISQMCIGEIAMSFPLDSMAIGQTIYDATGLTSPELIVATKE